MIDDLPDAQLEDLRAKREQLLTRLHAVQNWVRNAPEQTWWTLRDERRVERLRVLEGELMQELRRLDEDIRTLAAKEERAFTEDTTTLSGNMERAAMDNSLTERVDILGSIAEVLSLIKRSSFNASAANVALSVSKPDCRYVFRPEPTVQPLGDGYILTFMGQQEGPERITIIPTALQVELKPFTVTELAIVELSMGVLLPEGATHVDVRCTHPGYRQQYYYLLLKDLEELRLWVRSQILGYIERHRPKLLQEQAQEPDAEKDEPMPDIAIHGWDAVFDWYHRCLLYTSPSPRD